MRNLVCTIQNHASQFFGEDLTVIDKACRHLGLCALHERRSIFYGTNDL